LRDVADFFLTGSLILSLGALLTAFEKTQVLVGEYTILGLGLAAFLLSRYQKKTDVFFLAVFASVFMVSSEQHGFSKSLLQILAVSAGIGLFQACFLGARHKLLFSNVPASMKGWPILCLLAGFISVVFWSFRSLVF
jgi:hypothetical protein